MNDEDILHGFPKYTIEIPNKVSYPYIERCDIYIILNLYELFV